jgi:hypothetical protein
MCEGKVRLRLFSFYGVPSWVLVRIVVVAKQLIWLCPGKIRKNFLAIILHKADGGIPMMTTSIVIILSLPLLIIHCQFFGLTTEAVACSALIPHRPSHSSLQP